MNFHAADRKIGRHAQEFRLAPLLHAGHGERRPTFGIALTFIFGTVRRISFASLIALTIIAPHKTAGADEIASASATTLLIRGLIETFGAAGDAIGKITDGVRKLIVAGDDGWKTISAQRTHESLVELSASLTGLAASQRVGAIPALESYIRQPNTESWMLVAAQIGGVLNQVDAILTRLNQERTDLVLQPAYVKLQNTLRTRASLLSRLQGVPPPTTKAEIAELRALLERYRILVAQLESARDELNEYARNSEP